LARVAKGLTDNFETDKESMLDSAVQVVLNQGYASVSVLVRYLSVKYPQAVQLLNEMEKKGFIGPFNGAVSRGIFIDKNSYIKTI
jgi:S-DNA-T family DNA segregation ATPase FtsK/SpoIIIE